MLAMTGIAFAGLQVWVMLLIVGRGLLFRTKIYRPMLWNHFLSLLPLIFQAVFAVGLLLLAGLINTYEWGDDAVLIFRILMVLCLVIWALIFPNATYLITELNFSHRTENDRVPLYYDIVMVFSLAVTGFINALASLSGFQALLLIATTDSSEIPWFIWLIVMLYILASSFALYLGREVRVNSWDVVHPLAFAKKLYKNLDSWAEWRMAIGYTVTFAGLLAIAHLLVFSLLYSAFAI